MFLPMDENQFTFWKMRRSGTPNIAIANQRGISRQAVSKALLAMDGKIESALRDMAQSNQRHREDQCRTGDPAWPVDTKPDCCNNIHLRKARGPGVVRS